MNIYLTRNGQQTGPYTEQQLLEMVKVGAASNADLAWHDGLADWQQLDSIISFGAQPPPLPSQPPTAEQKGNGGEAVSSRLKGEIRLLEQYGDDVDKLAGLLEETERDPKAQKSLQKQFEQKMQIYWKQIELVKGQAPQSKDGHLAEAHYFTNQAIVLIVGDNTMRRLSDSSGGGFLGGAAKFATGVVAKQQEKAAAIKALDLLDKALGIADYPGAHFIKARVYLLLDRKQEALSELNYVISNFPDDEVYVEARQMKDAIENPPKKGMCFIATAAYGSPLAHEVLRLCRFRDDVLLKSKPGRCFVEAYYRISPPLARLIGKFAFLRSATRMLFLRPVLWFVSATKYNSPDT